MLKNISINNCCKTVETVFELFLFSTTYLLIIILKSSFIEIFKYNVKMNPKIFVLVCQEVHECVGKLYAFDVLFKKRQLPYPY